MAGSAPGWATAGLLLLATSLLLPWWEVAYTGVNGTPYGADRARLYSAPKDLVQPWANFGTGLLLVGALVVLFLRLAGREWRYSMPAWRKALSLGVVLSALAFVSALAWPKAVPWFWGGRTYAAEGLTETARPMWGWWVCGVGLLCLAIARRAVRVQPDAGGARTTAK